MHINGVEYGAVVASWSERESDSALDGKVVVNRWKLHTWQISAMLDTTFEALAAVEGTTVALTTTDYASRNEETTYYGAEVKNVSGDHSGPSFENVELQFLVSV